jgi:peptidoglycan/LPS O-acetylase OafA/YrhL
VDHPPVVRGARTRLPYIGALDGVRALAVAGVLLYHGGVAWLPGGFLGVDVFFVLSGFLITSLLMAELRATARIDLVRFWIRRARRLLPAAFVVIAVCLLVMAVFPLGDVARTRGDAVASFAYVNNWHQVLAERSYFESFGRPSLLEHLWSLAVEEQFYLLWPLFLGFALTRLGRRRTMLVTVAAAGASALAMGLLFDGGGDPSRVYFGTDTHASGLLIGALLAFLWPLGSFHGAPRAGAVWVLDAAAVTGLAAVLAAMATAHDFDPWIYRGGIAAVGVAAAVLIAAVSHPACTIGRALAVAPLRWIGQRSYGIYLWHWPVMALTRPGADVAWPSWVLVPLQIAATVLLAAGSYRWIEQPIRTGAARAWLDRRPPRRRLELALGAALALVVAAVFVGGREGVRAAAPLTATHSLAASRSLVQERATTSRPGTSSRAGDEEPLAVGASVMLAASAALGTHATVDAAVARHAGDILARLESYKASGLLPRRVVVQMGENGPVFGADVKRLERALAGVDRVVLVNVRVGRSWRAQVNDILAETVQGWQQARLADWYRASGKPGLLYDDGTHPTPRGRKVYARLVERALR